MNRRYAMSNKRLMTLSGVAIAASMLALAPDPAAARGFGAPKPP